VCVHSWRTNRICFNATSNLLATVSDSSLSSVAISSGILVRQGVAIDATILNDMKCMIVV
jgi:hypothetical protein